MDQISNMSLFGFFAETMGHFGTFLLKADTEDIEWHVFEEFDSESITFLHENSLNPLLVDGYISAEVYLMCQLLRKKFRNLENTSLWHVESVRTAPEWYEIMLLADKIKSMINLPDA